MTDHVMVISGTDGSTLREIAHSIEYFLSESVASEKSTKIDNHKKHGKIEKTTAKAEQSERNKQVKKKRQEKLREDKKKEAKKIKEKKK